MSQQALLNTVVTVVAVVATALLLSLWSRRQPSNAAEPHVRFLGAYSPLLTWLRYRRRPAVMPSRPPTAPPVDPAPLAAKASTPDGPPGGLWDSFWAEHASSDRLFHRLLWRIRFLFSQAYASALFKVPRSALPVSRLLEVGCGSARTLHYLGQRFPAEAQHSYAFDLSPQALELVQHLSPTFRPAIADALSIPLVDEACTVAFSIGLIEHFDRAVAAAMVREMARVTVVGGVVAVMVPWRSSLYNLVRQVFGTRWPFGPENPFRRVELRRFMQAQGLGDVRLHVIYASTLLAIGRRLPGEPPAT